MSRIGEALGKAAVEGYGVNELNQAQCNAPSLLEQLKNEKARVSQKYTRRIKELDVAIRQLENSGAEEIINESRNVLQRIVD